MLREGKIKTYNTERGFGFIQVDGEAKDLFFHIKDMPKAHVEPRVGEVLKFMMVEHQGKFKADHIQRLDLKAETTRAIPQSRAQQSTTKRPLSHSSSNKRATGFPSSFILIAVIVAGIFAYQKFKTASSDLLPQPLMIQSEPVVQQNFSCDGREHCSQMRSYEEALFFLKNCPNTKMDGGWHSV